MSFQFAKLIDELEAIGRRRALSDRESLMLERAVLVVDKRNIREGLTAELAAHGIPPGRLNFLRTKIDPGS